MTGFESILQTAGIALGTFVSEDLTCIGSGLMIRSGQLSWLVGLLGCTLGIFLGDVGLWLIGRTFGRRALAWAWVSKRLPAQRVTEVANWFDRRGWTTVLAARFLPGTRFPVYVAAGMLGRKSDRFLLWAFLAALLWTPLLVLLASILGEALATRLTWLFGASSIALVTAALILFLIARVTFISTSSVGRARLIATISRLWRWEFWPMWVFYIPLMPWIAWLSLRHRGFTTITAANPGIRPHGGIVGESKSAILARLPAEWIVSGAFLEPAPENRIAALQRLMAERSWNFPLVLKPDAGQRGAGVRLVRDVNAAIDYLRSHPEPILVQVYHPGPHEAGVFYYRMPGTEHGRIFSITDKVFPVLVGDGRSTIEELIWNHPRFRMQARTFLARLGPRAAEILRAGGEFRLTMAGNHCQGTLFRDGSQLITPALERAIDEIARQLDGFYFGRFDIRYADTEAFKAGREFSIVELNGVTSESTNIYDPSWSLLQAYRVLFQQWLLLFAIGAANRTRGIRVSSLWEVIADARRFYRQRASTQSD